MRREGGAAIWLLALLLFAATDPVHSLLARGPDDFSADLDAAVRSRRLGWAVLYPVMALLLWIWRAEALEVMSRCAVLPIALAWFGASCLWSDRPLDAAFGFAQFAMLLAFGMAAGRRLGPLGAAQAIGRAALLALGGSLAMAALSPEHAFGQQVNVGALRGLYGEKNHLATILSYGFAVTLFEAMARPHRRRLVLMALALLAGIVAARSSIALMQAALALGLAAAWAGLAGARFGAAAAACAAAAGAAALAGALPAALAILGEDATFNGRTPLWAALWVHVEARPLAGHGFGGFWGGEAAEAVRGALGWNARGAHNGWLTALLVGGAAGAALWIGHWAQVAARAAAALRPPAGRADAAATRAAAGTAALGAAVMVHLLWSMFESNQLMQMNVHAVIAGLCASMPARPEALPARRLATA